MADKFEKFARCAKVCGYVFLKKFLDCAFRVLIGWVSTTWCPLKPDFRPLKGERRYID